jgi:predicted RND superfamily exporter protein
LDRIAHLIVHRSRIFLAITAVVSLISVGMLFRMSFNADVSSFLLEGNETGEEFAALQEKYSATDPINVVASLPEGESFFAPANLAVLAELRTELQAIDGVEAVAVIVPEVNPITGAPLDAEAIRSLPAPAVEGFLAASPVSTLLLSEDGQHALLIVSPGDDATSTARRVNDLTHPGLELVFSGNPIVFASVLEVLSLFLLFIPPLVVALLIAVFFSTIGDLRLSVLAIVPAALGSLWTFGLIFGLGTEIDIVTVIVPIFIVVMGSADGLHFVTHFQEEAERTFDPVARVSSALRQVGVPMILTTISTAAGFLSLLVTDVQPIRQLGLFTAIGIVLAGIISFFSLPALLSRIEVKARHHKALLGPRLLVGIKAAVRTRVPAIVITAGIVVVAVFSLPRLEVNPDQLFFFKDDDPVRLAFERTEELFGGATPLAGEFVFDPANPEASIGAVAVVSAELEELDGVRRVFSVADVAGALPPDQLAAVMAGEVSLPVGEMVSEDGLRFLLLPADFSTDDLEAWLAFADEHEEIRTLTGMPVVWDEIARLVLRAQATSLIVAYVLVAVMLAVAYRRLRETIISLVPITLTIATVLGFLAVSGIQLNLLTAVISSIVIGVGIDYAIHYIAAIDYARGSGDGYVLRAIDHAGRPIVANALGIAVALSALWLSPLKVHNQVSMIMWVAMLTAAATSLIVIPALLPRAGIEPAVDEEVAGSVPGPG